MIILETKRLIIRDHREEDLLSHHKLLSNSNTMNFVKEIQTHNLEESKLNLKQAIDEIGKPKRTMYFLRIESKNKEHIGEIGYTVTDFTPVGKLVHLGYFINSEFWRQGFTTEALNEVIRFAFTENDVFRITTGCLKNNIASEKVMIKCGMIKEGEYKKFQWHDGELKDRVTYRLLREEWMEQKCRLETNIYLIRHAHSIYTSDELNRPLSEKGLKDADKVSELLSMENITRVVSSPYRRAVQTVEGIASKNGLRITLEERFKERRLAEESVDNFEKTILKAWKNLKFSLPGGESGCYAQNRGIEALKGLLKRFPGEKIAVGTHGNIMVLIMNYFDKNCGYGFWSTLNMPDIYKLTFIGENLIEIEPVWK